MDPNKVRFWQCTEMEFSNFPSGGFNKVTKVNPLNRQLVNPTSFLPGGFTTVAIVNRHRPRCFDLVEHQTMSAYIENKNFFTKSCHCQTDQNYQQPPRNFLIKVGLLVQYSS